jgi:hypothetical protein
MKLNVGIDPPREGVDAFGEDLKIFDLLGFAQFSHDLNISLLAATNTTTYTPILPTQTLPQLRREGRKSGRL